MGLPGTSLGAFRAYFFGCFGPQFFKLLVGNNTSQSLPITGLFGAKTFITVGTYILFFSEMWGRKPTLWISVPLMAACFIIVMVVKEPSPAPDGKVTPAGIGMEAMIFLTNSIYQFTWGPLPWPYTSEVSDTLFIYRQVQPLILILDLPNPNSGVQNLGRGINTVAF